MITAIKIWVPLNMFILALVLCVPARGAEPDVCTLIPSSPMTTTQLCWGRSVCHQDGDRMLCTGIQQAPCAGIRWPAYQCQRADGTKYIHEDKSFFSTTIAVPN